MSLLCRLGLHKAIESRIWNDGHYFSACARCNHTLIRKPDGRWQIVPPNFKVVWRPRTDEDVVWPSHIL